MHARDHIGLGAQRADVLESAAVDADLVGEDALAHDLLGQRVERVGDLLLTAFEASGELLEQLVEEGGAGGLTLLLVSDLEVLGLLGLAEFLDGFEDIVLEVAEDGEFDGRLGG